MSTRSTNANKKLHGIKQIGPNLFLVRIDQVNPRTGRAHDVRKRVHCQRIEQAVAERERLLQNSSEAGSKAKPSEFGWRTTRNRG